MNRGSGPPLIPLRVGVAQFTDQTGGNNAAAETLIDPVGIFSEAIREKQLFSSVKYLGIEVGDLANYQSIREKYGIDAVIVGRVFRLYVYDAPTFLGFTLLLPVMPLSVFGVPSIHERAYIELIYGFELVCCTTGEVLWASGRQSGLHTENAWVSFYNFEAVETGVFSRGLSETVRRTAGVLADHIKTERAKYTYLSTAFSPGRIVHHKPCRRHEGTGGWLRSCWPGGRHRNHG